MSAEKNKNLGELLLERGVVEQDTLQKALGLQKRRLGQILIEENLASPGAVVQALKDLSKDPLAQKAGQVILDSSLIDRFGDLLTNPAFFTHDPELANHFYNLYHAFLSKKYVPIETIQNKINLLLQKASEDLQKKIDFECSFPNINLDSWLVHDLDEVFLHLCRNAVDHGIEAPAQRMQQKKPEHGKIKVTLKIQKNTLCFECEDDGAGLDADSIFNKAKKLQITSKSREDLSDEEIFSFLFTPGFSMREQSNSYSGRGFGLDIAEAMTFKNDGRIQIQSEQGKYTRIQIFLPLNRMILPVVLFRKGEDWFGLPYFLTEEISLMHSTVDETLPALNCIFQSLSTSAVKPQQASEKVLGVAQVIDLRASKFLLKDFLVFDQTQTPFV